jgi:phytol kinase
MPFFITVIAVGLIVLLSELVWRNKKQGKNRELGRKIVHMSVGALLAFSPYFLHWYEIEIISFSFFIVIVISKSLNIFTSIHAVDRKTFGEIFFALSFGLVALVTHEKSIYLAAILLMSIADGAAAIMGIYFGKNNFYRVFGTRKSVVGTTSFFVCSLIILLLVKSQSGLNGTYAYLPAIAVVATVLENVSVWGADDITVPIVTALLLELIK